MSKLISEKNTDLPCGWTSSKTNDVIKIIDYRGRTPPYVDKGIPHIRSANIKEGKIFWEKIKFVSEETYQKYMTRGMPKEGDILLTTEAPLGEVSLIPEEKFCLAQRLVLLRCKKILFHKFLLYQIMSPDFQGYLTGKKTGTVVTGISSKNFKSLEILIPPLNEQSRIVEKIEQLFSLIDNIEKNTKTKLSKLNSLRISILKQAFKGKLVPQDPNDEPAEILLQKLKQEKEQYEEKIKQEKEQLKQKQKASRSTKNVK